MGEFTKDWENENTEESGTAHHRILQCGGCDTVYFQTIWRGPDLPEPEIKYWPEPAIRERPRWAFKLLKADHALYSLLNEVYSALNSEAFVLAAIGTRTIFDRSAELLGVDQSYTFAKKLDELKRLGLIGDDERKTLQVLTDAGSAAAHRGWKPERDDLLLIIDALEGFVYRNFVIRAALTKLESKIPGRQRGKSATAKAKGPT
jgi:hypothetical protein